MQKQSIFTVISILVGISLVLFRKQFVRSLFKAQMSKAGTADKERFKALEAAGYSGMLFKLLEGAAVIIGLIFIGISVSQFASRRAENIAAIVFEFIIYSIFATGGASLLILVICPFLFRKVNKYVKEKYTEQWLRLQNAPVEKKLALTKETIGEGDSVLRKLRIRASIIAGILFVIFFTILLFGQYFIIRATS